MARGAPGGITAADVGRCFSESYEEARAKFRDAATAVAAEQHSLEVAKDDAGTYTTDIAIVRGSGRGLAVIVSGTHGVEGYAGSAIQLLLLGRLREAPAPVATLVFVHALNPYGMAHFRRVNENNVDLARNALHPGEFERLRSADRLHSTYMKFDSLFNPKEVPGWLYVNVGFWFKFLYMVLAHGMLNLKRTLVAATYTETKGLVYGGRELQPSHRLLQEFMARTFHDVHASNVTWVDVHTGLGPSGVDVLLGSAQDRAELGALYPRAAGEFDGCQYAALNSTEDVLALRCTDAWGGVTAPNDASQAGGYEFTVGINARADWLNQMFKPESGSVLSFVQEFGTRPQPLVGRALILENMGYQYDRANHTYWRSFTRDAFYIRTPEWKRRILKRGEAVFRTAVARTEAVASKL